MYAKLALVYFLLPCVFAMPPESGDDERPALLEQNMRDRIPQLSVAQYVSDSDFEEAFGVVWLDNATTGPPNSMVYLNRFRRRFEVTTNAETRKWIDSFAAPTGQDELKRHNGDPNHALQRLRKRVHNVLVAYPNADRLGLLGRTGEQPDTPRLVVAWQESSGIGAVHFAGESGIARLKTMASPPFNEFERLLPLKSQATTIALGKRALAAWDSAGLQLVLSPAEQAKLGPLLSPDTVTGQLSTFQAARIKARHQQARAHRLAAGAFNENRLVRQLAVTSSQDLGPRQDPMLWLIAP